MKKFIILILVLSGGFVHTMAQNPGITVDPPEIDALTENVTFTFDITGTTVEGVDDVYIWAWSNDIGSPSEALICYEGSSASWGNISPNARLQPVDGNANLRKLVLPLTVTRNDVEVTFKNVADLFGVSSTPGKIKSFGFLLRNLDGSKQTPGGGVTSVTLKALEFEESVFRTFPAAVSNMDVVSVYFNQTLATEPDEQVMTDIKVLVTLTDDNGTAIVAHGSPVATTEERDGEFSYTFIPEMLFEVSAEDLSNVTKMKVVFSGILNKTDGTTEEVTTSAFQQDFSDYE